jgi:hypothetical protein
MTAPTSLDQDLMTLLAAINNLPASSKSGCCDGDLSKYLTPGLTKVNDPKPVFPDHKGGAYFIWKVSFSLLLIFLSDWY